MHAHAPLLTRPFALPVFALPLQLVKHKWMAPMTEKVWNARINVWLRAPGLLMCACCIWVGWTHGVSVVGLHPAALLACMLLCVLNGQYYMQVVVGNTFIRTREDEESDAYNS